MTLSSGSTTTVTLPSGRTATVRGFSGLVQKILADEKRMSEGDGFDAVVREVAHVDGKALTTVDVKALRIGDRDRILIEARRRTYGDAVRDKVRCPECGEEYPVVVDLSKVESVPYPTEDIVVTLDGMAFVLGWLSVRHENDHTEGVKKKVWAITDLPLVQVKTVDGERVGSRGLLELDGAILDGVRKAARLSVPLHRTDPERDPQVYEPPFDAIPQGGTATRVETWCAHCDARNVVQLTGLMDSLFRSLRSLKD